MLNNLQYADVYALVCGSNENLQNAFTCLQKIHKKFSLEINCDKTNILQINMNGADRTSFCLDVIKLHNVENLKYLRGSIYQ